ncbi:MAG: beta-propeller domain-containing protein [Granulosicoccus sp.]
MKYVPFAVSLVATMTLSACSDSKVETSPVSPGEVSSVEARLKNLGDSDAFYAALKEALINQSGGLGNDVDSPVVDEELSAAPSEALGAPQQAGDAAASDVVAESNEVTSTNVQELGVDEQDRVKLNAAGTQLFVLHTDYSYDFAPGIVEPAFAEPDIAVEPAFPDAIDEPSSLSLPAPQQSRTTLRILALDSETPDATGITNLEVDLEGYTADGFYLYETSDESSAIVTASVGGFWGYWDQSFAFSGLRSVIAKVDVEDAANAELTETFTIDGQIISSRRIGDSLFFASRYYPAIPGVQPWEQGGEQWREAVESADLSELMPEYVSSNSDAATPLVDAASCFVAPVPENQPYYSPDIITLGVIDLASMELRDSECFLGATETLYANTESVFLATTQYSYSDGPVTLDGAAVDVSVDVFETDTAWFDPRTSTDIHQFDIEGDQLSYAGSGSVRGHLGWNDLQKPFRMSESDGYLRVATMNDQQGPGHSPILLNILQADGEGSLRTVSTLPNDSRPKHIGEPGEQLYASRFLGDRAYLVTFRQTDPLYVVDLSDPEDPEVKGELKIDGYSDYLQPVSEDFLLGIGKDAVPADGGRGDGRGAWVQGIKLSLFDVSDPSSPSEVQSVLVGERGTDSVALRNHRAIAIQPATDLHPMRVSFGIDVYGEPTPVSSPTPAQAFDYARWNYTGLHGFDVTVGANASITSRGALVIDRANGADRFYADYGDDRAVMVNDAVFYVHGNSVYPALWDNLGALPDAR